MGKDHPTLGADRMAFGPRMMQILSRVLWAKEDSLANGGQTINEDGH